MAGFGSGIDRYPAVDGERRAASGSPDLDAAVLVVVSQAQDVSDFQLKDLLLMLQAQDTLRGDRELTLTEELTQNMRIIRQLRAEYFGPKGKRKEDTSLRDLKDLLGALNTLSATIGKQQQLASHQDRMRVLEKAVTSAVQKLPEDAQERFFCALEDNLIYLPEGEDDETE